MSSDIVERLRQLYGEFADSYVGDDVKEAADEIERLRAAGDALDRAISGVSCGGTPEVMDALMKAHGQWLKARRG